MIEFNCPECDAVVKAPEVAAGRQGKCKKCGTQVFVPSGILDSTAKHSNASIPSDNLPVGKSGMRRAVQVPLWAVAAWLTVSIVWPLVLMSAFSAGDSTRGEKSSAADSQAIDPSRITHLESEVQQLVASQQEVPDTLSAKSIVCDRLLTGKVLVYDEDNKLRIALLTGPDTVSYSTTDPGVTIFAKSIMSGVMVDGGDGSESDLLATGGPGGGGGGSVSVQAGGGKKSLRLVSTQHFGVWMEERDGEAYQQIRLEPVSK